MQKRGPPWQDRMEPVGALLTGMRRGIVGRKKRGEWGICLTQAGTGASRAVQGTAPPSRRQSGHLSQADTPSRQN